MKKYKRLSYLGALTALIIIACILMQYAFPTVLAGKPKLQKDILEKDSIILDDNEGGKSVPAETPVGDEAISGRFSGSKFPLKAKRSLD